MYEVKLARLINTTSTIKNNTTVQNEQHMESTNLGMYKVVVRSSSLSVHRRPPHHPGYYLVVPRGPPGALGAERVPATPLVTRQFRPLHTSLSCLSLAPFIEQAHFPDCPPQVLGYLFQAVEHLRPLAYDGRAPGNETSMLQLRYMFSTPGSPDLVV